MNEKEIFALLKETKRKALAIYSNFRVAAVLVSKDGQVVTGVNIESSSYGLTICAERVAIFKALSEGIREFRSIYIMSDGQKPCPPCGACRQVLMDYAPNIEVKMVSEAGEVEQARLTDLLPHAFSGEALKQR